MICSRIFAIYFARARFALFSVSTFTGLQVILLNIGNSLSANEKRSNCQMLLLSISYKIHIHTSKTNKSNKHLNRFGFFVCVLFRVGLFFRGLFLFRSPSLSCVSGRRDADLNLESGSFSCCVYFAHCSVNRKIVRNAKIMFTVKLVKFEYIEHTAKQMCKVRLKSVLKLLFAENV